MADATPPAGSTGAGAADSDGRAAPDHRPRPQYGEYAPAGWVSPVQPTAEPVDPVEPGVARMPPPAGPRLAAPPRSTNDAAALVRPDRGLDRTLTRVLLIIGVFGALIGWLTGSSLSESLAIALEQYGVDPGTMPEWLDVAGPALAYSHALLYLLAVGLTIWSRSRGRPTSWAPLSAGVIAAIIFWSIMSAAVAPYVDQLSRAAG
jgi:hypothetical protein